MPNNTSSENVQVSVDNVTLALQVSMSANLLLLTVSVKTHCIGSSYSDIMSLSLVEKD